MENRIDIDAPVVMEQTVTKDHSVLDREEKPYPFPLIEATDNLEFLARIPHSILQL